MPLKMDLIKDYAGLLRQRLAAKGHPAPRQRGRRGNAHALPQLAQPLDRAGAPRDEGGGWLLVEG